MKFRNLQRRLAEKTMVPGTVDAASRRDPIETHACPHCGVTRPLASAVFGDPNNRCLLGACRDDEWRETGAHEMLRRLYDARIAASGAGSAARWQRLGGLGTPLPYGIAWEHTREPRIRVVEVVQLRGTDVYDSRWWCSLVVVLGKPGTGRTELERRSGVAADAARTWFLPGVTNDAVHAGIVDDSRSARLHLYACIDHRGPHRDHPLPVLEGSAW